MVASIKTVKGSIKTTRKSDKRLSKANYEFDVYDDFWQLDSNLKLNLMLLTPLNLSLKFELNFRKALADYASEFSLLLALKTK
jgi:hypothetical protein